MYFSIMVAASTCMLITALILVLVTVPADGRAAKYRKAKNTLTGATVILGVLNLLQVAFDSGGIVSHFGPCLALAVSYLQAMLFTMAIMVLIRPEEVTWHRIFTHLAVILMVDAVLLSTFFLLSRQAFLYVYELGIVGYLLQLAYYVRWFRQGRQVFMQQIRLYYEEEEIERGMRWIFFLFRAALAVGLLSLLMIFNEPSVDLLLTIALTVFYAVFAASFINYGMSAPIILPAIYAGQQPTAVGGLAADDHLSRLEQWIRNKGYLTNNQPVADIAQQAGMTVEQFQMYFRDVIGEDFRTWRVRRRIDEAKQLMREHPEMSVTQVGKMCGFNDRSFFYQQFLRFAGVSVTEFRNQVVR